MTVNNLTGRQPLPAKQTHLHRQYCNAPPPLQSSMPGTSTACARHMVPATAGRPAIEIVGRSSNRVQFAINNMNFDIKRLCTVLVMVIGLNYNV
jgi:hypothetical protein